MSELTPEDLHRLLSEPAMARPQGAGPDSSARNGEAIAIAVVCLFFATSTMLMRTYARFIVLKTIHIEDVLGIAGFGCYILFTWCYFMFLHLCGFHVHQWNIQGYTMVRAGKIWHIVDISYSCVMLCWKTAILLEWLRTFAPRGTPRNTMTWTCRLMIIANVLFYGGVVISCLAECVPIERFWEVWRPGHCFNRRARDLTTGGINIAQDVVILVFPQRVIWSLHTKGARKVGISIMFSVGLLTCALAIGRLYAYSKVQYTMNIDDNQDSTYTASPVIQWAFGEMTCLLLVFTVPWIPRALAGRPEPETTSSHVPEHSWSRIHRTLPRPRNSTFPSMFTRTRDLGRDAMATDLDDEAMPASQSRRESMKKDRESDIWAVSVELIPAKPIYDRKLSVSTNNQVETDGLGHSEHSASDAATR